MTGGSRLKLGLDARLYGQRGIGRYVSGLADGLLSMKLPLDIIAFTRAGSVPGLSSVPLPTQHYARLEQRALPQSAREQGCSLLHLVDNMGARNYEGVQVVTVHDLFFLESPRGRQKGAGWKAWAAWWYRKRNFRKSLERARKIICPSAWTAAALEKRFPETYRRTVVARPGVGPPFGTSAAVRSGEVLKKYGLAASPVLIPGAAERRKNVAGAVEGFFSARGRGLAADIPLAVYGLDEEGLLRHWPELGDRLRAGEFRVLGSLPDEDLAALLAGSFCLLFPSLAEGVGFPALEAAACGCPVIAGEGSAISEFMDKAVLYTDGTRQNIAEKLLEMASQNGLRATLAERGPRRAALFSWGACAEAHWAVYRSCLAGGGPG